MNTTSHLQRIFVSHNHKDAEFCRVFVESLTSPEREIWYDEFNLGWGAIRDIIQHEIAVCDHFIAILSPAAVTSSWVNAEINGAIEMLRQRNLQTFALIVAEPCKIPLLLRKYHRFERTDDGKLSVNEVAKKAAAQWIEWTTSKVPDFDNVTQPPPMPLERCPQRLLDLGYKPDVILGVEVIIPPVCDVSGGEFLMGSNRKKDREALDAEFPQHKLQLSSFQIGRFPVTVAEYACYVRASGERPSSSHTREYGWQTQPGPSYGSGYHWESQLRHLEHPVTAITWHNAMAYAAWLTKITGKRWRLPSEAEWEKAARWDSKNRHACIYPWGDSFDSSRCNTYESKIGMTTPIGLYPSGVSPYGAYDMVGNVWEWTRSIAKPYPYNPNDGREIVDANASYTFRGGSWNFYEHHARVAFRPHCTPDNAGVFIGFRLALVSSDFH